MRLALALLLAAGLCAVLVKFAMGLLLRPSSDVATNQAALHRWHLVLDPVLHEFDAIPAPAGLRSDGNAAITACSVDSGSLQPVVGQKTWRSGAKFNAQKPLEAPSASTTAGFHKIIRSLVDDGWTVERAYSDKGLVGDAEKANRIQLWEMRNSNRIDLGASVDRTGVTLAANFAGAPEMCYLNSRSLASADDSED